jgi:hypothetical protein
MTWINLQQQQQPKMFERNRDGENLKKFLLASQQALREKREYVRERERI